MSKEFVDYKIDKILENSDKIDEILKISELIKDGVENFTIMLLLYFGIKAFLFFVDR